LNDKVRPYEEAAARGLKELIQEVGRDLVACRRACGGVVCRLDTGQLPRCLFLETEHRSGARGAAIVGLNPGRSSHDERNYYLAHGCTYDATVSWFQKHGPSHPYYRHLRKLADALGLTGPILWTELAKCESAPGVKGPPLQTFRNCTRAFLQRELEVVPDEWPLLGVGAEAYKALAYRFPNRTVLGVPHPTGSRGHFHALFKSKNGHLRKAAAMQGASALGRKGASVWLTIGPGTA
jgi:hypothetical protein